MAVVINEMEVILETPKRPGMQDPERLPAPAIPTLQPFDLMVIEEARMKKEARLLAH